MTKDDRWLMIIDDYQTVGNGEWLCFVSRIVDQVKIPSRDVDYFWKGAIKNLDKELEL
jgi:hypothetical protein